MSMTFSDFPHWIVNGMLPVGAVALYGPRDVCVELSEQLEKAVLTGKPFLGRETIKANAFAVGVEALHDIEDISRLLSAAPNTRLVVFQYVSSFKAKKNAKVANNYADFSTLAGLASFFKVCILLLPEKRIDAIDFAVDTIVQVDVPTTADENAPYRFKVEGRDVPRIRGRTVKNPASNLWEAVN